MIDKLIPTNTNTFLDMVKQFSKDGNALGESIKDLKKRIRDHDFHLAALYIPRVQGFLSSTVGAIYAPAGGGMAACKEIAKDGLVNGCEAFAIRLDGTVVRFHWRS
ncbi:hypothetical protein [Photobacterium kishitanii]|uniref:Uncharacterized protein n=1 Tax=Photobacterium kishitanii TaxID=318456 RepID=A0A2T3KL55_9GAMM|nr:hypothetical protein [Photobacterium kishitanii]PSV00421.1 hypothetical protein C9J27_04635 [Photobacterium kishitanii]